jgi:adenosylmethionine-8-amino-7-oxononanoate aminotransferase
MTGDTIWARTRPDDDWPFLPGRAIRIVDGGGAWLVTDDGRRILDAAGGAICANVGHGRAEVAEAMSRASLGASYVVPTWRTPQREALVQRLREHWLPDELHHVHLTCGGSEAMEAAIKIALQHFAAKGETRRTRIMSRDLSYHGATISMSAFSGHAGRKRGLEGFLAKYPHAPTPWPLRCALGAHHPDAGRHYVDAPRAAIEAAGPDTIAAFAVEPITGSSGGAIVPPAGYLQGVRALCDEFGILLIVDEVMTGFGRTGKKFGCDHWGLKPDILVAGKGLAGGYAPVSGVYATPAVAEPIREAGYDVMFHTFAALPSACAAADAVLSIIQRENLIERAAVLGERLAARLNDLLGQHPNVAEIRGMGLLQAIEIVRDRDTLEPFAAADKITNRIAGRGLKNGVFVYGGGTGAVRDIICLGPPFICTEAEIDLMADVLAQSVREVLG